MSPRDQVKPPKRRQASHPAPPTIALIGFGEVGQTLAPDLWAQGVDDLAAWDRLFSVSSSGPRRTINACAQVKAARSMASAVAGRNIVICAVTAGNCITVAREAAASLAPNTFYLDLNSVSPQTKKAAAEIITAAGGRYVEAAVMSPVAPRRIASPILICGPHATAFLPLARTVGFSGMRHFGPIIGRAAAAKMCRSMMIKGLEALFLESLLTARRHGVVDTVLESLHDLFPHEQWESVAHYFISRSLQHGVRRSEEMTEAARTAAEIGVEPLMSVACAMRQEWAALNRPPRLSTNLTALLDGVLATDADLLESA